MHPVKIVNYTERDVARWAIAYETATKAIDRKSMPAYTLTGCNCEAILGFIQKDERYNLRCYMNDAIASKAPSQSEIDTDETSQPMLVRGNTAYTVFTSAEAYYWQHTIGSIVIGTEIVEYVAACKRSLRDTTLVREGAKVGILGPMNAAALFTDIEDKWPDTLDLHYQWTVPSQETRQQLTTALYGRKIPSRESGYAICQTALDELLADSDVGIVIVTDFTLERWLKQQTLVEQYYELLETPKLFWRPEGCPIPILSAQRAVIDKASWLATRNLSK